MSQQTSAPSGQSGIKLMNAGGSNKRFVPVPEAPQEVFPQFLSWMPDGQHIVCEATAEGQTTGPLVETDLSGASQIPVAAGKPVTEASVSPDGTRIAYLDPTGGSNLRDMGSGYRPLWSPDGLQILFEDLSTSNWVIANAEGSNRQEFMASTSLFPESWQATP